MFLKDIQLHNFKNLKNIELSFLEEEQPQKVRQWTFILGENGTGKSNILKAIALLTAGSDALGELIGNPSDWITYGKKECRVSATLIDANNKDRNLSIEIRKGDELKSLMKRSYESLDVIDRALHSSTKNYFIVGYGANRTLANGSRSHSQKTYFNSKRGNAIATLFHREATLHSLEDWAVDLDYRKDKTGLKIIEETLNRFLPEVTFDSINKKNKQLIFATADGKIPLEYLSDGYQNMAAWLGDVLFRLAEVFDGQKKPLTARGVLLIDELELHLHPAWQRNLIKLLKNILPHFQVISTTHSPLTAQQAGAGELFCLTRNKHKNIELNPYSGNPQYMPVNELLISDLFGLGTDESLEIEEKKQRYKKLKAKKLLSKSEKSEFNDLSDFLMASPLTAQNQRDKKQLELIEKLLKKRK